MKKQTLLLSLAASLFLGCSEDTNIKTEVATTKQETQESKKEIPKDAIMVLEAINAAGYTYAKVDDKGKIYWIAGPEIELNAGTPIKFEKQMVLPNFTSRSLERTFDELTFASIIIPLDDSVTKKADTVLEPKSISMGVCPSEEGKESLHVKSVEIEKNKDGYKVEELFAKKEQLEDKEILLNAQIVKIAKNIMNKDWIHLQDGSGENGTHDIVATMQGCDYEVGDKVTIKGRLKANLDFGHGYKYDALIEDATLSSLN
jgi:hypothetical protein